MIQYSVESFNTKPLGNTHVGVDTLWQIISFSGWMFKGAIMLALPAIVSLLVVSLSFGIMMKAAPQINIFSVGFPITLLLGIVIVFVTLLNFYPHIKVLLNEGLNVAKDMVQ
jgi:flagellar biosynthetic protein FliR